MSAPIVEPAAKPSEPAKSEKVAATAQAGMPRLPKVDAESIEMKLGTYWFVRIGVMLLLTGLVFLAYRSKGWFVGLEDWAKVSLFYLLSVAMGGVGFWLQRTKEQLKNYGQVLLAGGFAGVYFTTYAAHVIEPVKIIDNATIALLLLFAWGGFMVWVADRLKSETIALFATGASYYATYVPLIHSGDVPRRLGDPFLKPCPRGGGGGVHAAQPLAEDAGAEPVGVLRRFSSMAVAGW